MTQKLNPVLFFTQTQLAGDYLPLYLPLVKGKDFAAFVDSGTKTMFPQLLTTLREAGVPEKDLRLVIQTHAHADHIGCNAALKAHNGCLIAAHAQTAYWHTDPERHYQEWARPIPELLPDTPERRASVFDWFDAPHHIDISVDEGSTINLGGGVVLEAFRFPGHMRNDLGWLETSTRTLILGDAITATEWPHFHIHVTVPGYRQTLARLPGFLKDQRVSHVFMTHFGPVPAGEALAMTGRATALLDQLDRDVLRLCASKPAGISLADIWTQITTKMGKLTDHHALTSIYAHIEDFIGRGLLREVEPRVYTLR